jgi:predicted metalloprotease with PDZ domain
MRLSDSAVALFLSAVLSSFAAAQLPLRHPAEAQELRFARSQPVVHYTLKVDSADLSGFSVEIRIRNAPREFVLAMAAHPEYDDRYWRYVREVTIDSAGERATMVRADSALWRVKAPRGAAIIRYRLQLPPAESPRAAWRPFLSPTGGLVGGPHSFMYMVGAELAPVHLTVVLPESWQIASGLAPTSSKRTFFAPTIDALVDGPLLVGQLREWHFAIDGAPHRVVYWPSAAAERFDTASLIRSIRGITARSIELFGRAPWREYTFLLQDSAFGALEHPNSVTVGVPSVELARDINSSNGEIAHEFLHAWNLMRIRPVEYQAVSYRTQPPTAGLWFSEGLTMFYADLIRRRAGLLPPENTRIAHLANLIARYLATPDNAHYSAEQVSRVAYNTPPGALPLNVSTHLQGELIGTILDLVIRSSTGGRRSMDDVMRLMLERYSGEHGFRGADVQRVVAAVCGCNAAPVFDAYVRGAAPMDFDRYLTLIGLRTRVTVDTVRETDGRPAVDLRIYAVDRDSAPPRIVITHPQSAWAAAGLRTGDEIVRLNGTAVRNWREVRPVLSRLRIGDTLRVEVRRSTGTLSVSAVAAGFQRPVVRIEEVAGTAARVKSLRDAWMAGQSPPPN